MQSLAQCLGVPPAVVKLQVNEFVYIIALHRLDDVTCKSLFV